MQNDKLSKLAFEVDDIIAGLVIKYEIDPLTLTSIMLARLVLTNDFTDYSQYTRTKTSIK